MPASQRDLGRLKGKSGESHQIQRCPRNGKQSSCEPDTCLTRCFTAERRALSGYHRRYADALLYRSSRLSSAWHLLVQKEMILPSNTFLMPKLGIQGLILIAALADSSTAAADKSNAVKEALIDEMVIVASRVPTTFNQVGVSVSLLDADDITLLGYADVATLLDTQPGVAVTEDGGFGKAANVRIRGEEGYRTRILFDGIDIADPSSPQISPRIEHLMTQGLSRIEILRGPQGLLYGADAGGVISIRSQQPTTGFNGALRTEYGAAGFNLYGINIAGGNDQISGALSASDLTTDGINARADDVINPDLDGYENQTIHSTVTAQVNKALSLSATFHDIDGNNEYDNCYDSETFAVINHCRDNYAQRAWRVAGSWATADSNHELAYSESQTDRQFVSANVESYRTSGGTKTGSFLGSWRPSEQQRLTYGVDISTQSLDDGSQKSRDNTGIYSELLQRLGNTTLTAGLRYDDNDDFGENTAWRVSAVHPIELTTGALTLRAAAGTGFRAPSLYEIAYNTGPFSYAPARGADLAQEKTGGWEIAARFEHANHISEIIYFDQWINEEIYFDLASYSGYLQRAGRARAKGIELVSEIAVTARFKLLTNGAWTDTETRSGAQRPYRPTWILRVGLQWQGDQSRVALTSRSAADAVDISGNPADDYSVVDLSATYQLGTHLRLNTRLENLFDDDYQQVAGFNSQGRAWYAGLQYDF